MEATLGLKVCQLCAVDFTLKHFLLPLVDGMTARGWNVTAVCSDGTSIQALREQGYRITTLPIARSMNPLKALVSLWKLVCLFRSERFDVVHAHTPVAALLGRIAARLSGVPLVIYTAHGFYFHEAMPRWKYRFFVCLEKVGGRCTDLLFSQSSEDALDAVRENIVAMNKVLAIGNGVNAARFELAQVRAAPDVRTELGIPPQAFVIGMIGRQVREKGIAEFLRAAEMIAQNHSHVWFLLIGERLSSDHADGVTCELDHARKVLGARLVTPGLRSDIPDLLGAMDVFCLPSWREGMPRTIIEAMMMARPVIATNIRGSREEVVINETGLLAPVRDPTALADAMDRFITAPEWAKRCGAAGRKRALELYDEKRVIELQLRRIELEIFQRGLIRQPG